jgi:hypothetical protein
MIDQLDPVLMREMPPSSLTADGSPFPSFTDGATFQSTRALAHVYPGSAGAMPRYFFDIDDGRTLTPDETGLELDDVEAVRREAIKALPEIAQEVLPEDERRQVVVTARDSAGRRILTARLTLTVEY